jgi:adenylate cyclase
MFRSAHAVLLVDDDPLIHVLVTRRLDSNSVRVTSVGSGRAALDLMRTEGFDLVLLDLNMPDMDGLATLDAIKSDPQLASVPVIVLTASNAHSSVAQCLSLGAAGYLLKPIDPLVLLQRVHRQLTRRR